MEEKIVISGTAQGLDGEFSVSPELGGVVEKALADIRGRSFSGRNPELGKMIKCAICGRRHRQVQNLFTHSETDGVKRASKFIGTLTCEQVHAVSYITEELNDETGEFEQTNESPFKKDTAKSFDGALQFKGKRRKQRGNFKGLQLVELTQELFPKYQDHYTTRTEVVDGHPRNITEKTFETDKDAMHAARGEAAAILRRGRRAVAKRKRQQQQLSRAINRGLAAAGSRI